MTSDLLAFLSRLPGRCVLCGWHVETQGHAKSCSGVNVGHRLAAEGMARATDAHPEDVARVDAAIAQACKSGTPFSANDFRVLVGDLDQPKVVGARIRAWVAAKKLRRVGDEPSTLPGTHAHRIGLYLPT